MRDRRDTMAQRNCSMKNAFTPSLAMIRLRPNQKTKGGQHMKCLPTLAAAFLIGAAAVQFSTVASGQGDGWIKLIDGNYKAGDWTEVGKANWAVKDGALMADKLAEGKDPAYLVSKNGYKDFEMKVEFWTDDDANSGIFIRCDQSG